METSTQDLPEVRWVSIAQLRSQIADTLNRVAYGGERMILHRRGKPTAAVVSLEDLKLLQRAEDRYWAEEGLRAEAESDARGEPTNARQGRGTASTAGR